MSLLSRRTDEIDDYQSPPEVLDPLLPYLKPQSIVWECAAGAGNLVKRLCAAGHHVVPTDILTGTDFLIQECPYIYDVVITNPPYTLKNEFLERCYSLGTPFALLLPVAGLDSKRRQALYKQHGLEILVLPKQVASTSSSTGKLTRFVAAWFTWKLLPHPLIFT